MMFSKIVGSILLAASAASALSAPPTPSPAGNGTPNRHAQHHSRVPITTGAHTKQQNNNNNWQCVHNSNYHGRHSDKGYTDNFCQYQYCLKNSVDPTKYPAPGCYYSGFTSSNQKDFKQCLCTDNQKHKAKWNCYHNNHYRGKHSDKGNNNNNNNNKIEIKTKNTKYKKQ
eukprot:Pgem_evm1s3386